MRKISFYVVCLALMLCFWALLKYLVKSISEDFGDGFFVGVFLTVYLGDGPHTVRGLAAALNVSKPAITRALDRLGELDLARRKVDPADRRSVLVQRTVKGSGFLRELRQMMVEAEQVTRDLKPLEAMNDESQQRRAV